MPESVHEMEMGMRLLQEKGKLEDFIKLNTLYSCLSWFCIRGENGMPRMSF